jgi:hypothetical protein
LVDWVPRAAAGAIPIITECEAIVLREHQLAAENKKPDAFEINAKKKRVRALAEKRLESATKCGTLDAGHFAPRDRGKVRSN